MSLNIVKDTRNLLAKNILAYLTIILVTPILTRLYEPGQFGTLSLMIFASSLFGILFTARLELAIPLVRESRPLYNLIKLLVFSALVCFITFSVFVFSFHDEILEIFFDGENHGNWLYVVPLYGFTLSLNSILILFLTKGKQFSKIGYLVLTQNCAFCFAALIFSSYALSFNGLIVAKFIGLLVSILFASAIISKSIKEIICLRLNFRVFKKTIGDLKQFVQFNLPISVMGIIGKDLMVLIFAFSQGTAYAGFYAMARVVSELPTTMISSALGPVFYSQTATSLNDATLKDKLLNEINIVLKLIFTVVIPAYLIFALWAIEFFTILLGEKWATSGAIFKFLLPLSIISLLSCWLIRLFEVMRKQNISFKIQFTFEFTGFVVALIMVYCDVRLELILASIITCFSFIPSMITFYALKMLGFNRNSRNLVIFLLVLFALVNALTLIGFPNDSTEIAHGIWLIFSSVLFFLIGHKVFKNYRLKDLNDFW